MALRSYKFEIFGKVQGVYFRKHTEEKAQQLGLVGFCENTKTGTVIGEAQGPADKMEEMRKWLSTVGSPSSKITKAEFKDEKAIDTKTYSAFGIRR